MEKVWYNRVTKLDVLKKLIKYKKLWYNHVTYLWWEPFIQPVFLDALKIWKKLGYTILVTTNATTLHLHKQASKYLSYIDELILSVEAIDNSLQQKISRTNVFVHWEKVFENIYKYWNWSYLKVNIVITKDNLWELFNIVKYLVWKWIKNIAITYPDISIDYYWKKHIIEAVAPKYSETIKQIINIYNYCLLENILFKIVDFPFCVFPEKNRDSFIKLTDDYDFETRIKINHNNQELDRWNLDNFRTLPRKRRQIKKCELCKYKNTCWWPSYVYKLLYWLEEINTIN
jgi:hypothetical protein